MANVTELHVNGARRRIDADAERPLLSVLRDDLDLTGSKYGCAEGRCGACTLLLDGRPIRLRTTPVSAAVDRQVRTIVAVAPAVGNAIFQATGRRLRSLPMVPRGLPDT